MALVLTVLVFCLTACGGQEKDISADGIQSNDSVNSVSVNNVSVNNADGERSKVLVAYFSATGNTKGVAQKIAQVSGAELFEIVPAVPYTSGDLNYNNSDSRANKEQNDPNARPEISSKVMNMEDYGTVIIGYPIWWGIEPRIIDTFMEAYDFSGKTLVNFCTSGSSGIDSSTSNLKAKSPNAKWIDGKRFSSSASLADVESWFQSLDIKTGDKEDDKE